MGSHDAHYGGELVDGARMLALFGDVATELCVRADGDEGLFRAYDSVEFLAPVRAGDFIEAEGRVVRWGNTSMTVDFEARKVVAAGGPHASSAETLTAPVVVCRARGTVVVQREFRRPVGARPGPCIITAAIVGAETTRAQNPHLPLSADELAADAARCVAAGASVIHLHARDAAGNASQSAEHFGPAIAKIRKACDVIIQTSTGGAVGMSVAERAGPLSLSGAAGPDMATLNVGTINFGDDIFANKSGDTVEMAKRIFAHGAMPEIEIYDAGHIDILAQLHKDGFVQPPFHVQFVLGVRGALSASEKNLRFLLERMHDLSAPFTWGVAGIGRHQLPMAELAAKMGGNVRVGLEDNIYLAKGVLAEGSGPLVAKAAELCNATGRKIATVSEARAILGVHAR
jgi:3-keto-5-aminohexanoate cleavage enzyme